MGYYEPLAEVAHRFGFSSLPIASISFTWVMPSALLVTFLVAGLLGLVDRSDRKRLGGLTWYTRHKERTKL